MSSFLTNLTVIQQLAKDLIKGKQLNYSEECIPYYVDQSKFAFENIENLRTISGHLLKASLIRHRNLSNSTRGSPNSMTDQRSSVEWTQSKLTIDNNSVINQKCVVFLHGLGSSRLEAMPMLEMLSPEYCLFAFDFSGSGKSEGENITYGFRQSEDIQTILDYLRQYKGIKQFVIWGRSMGAVAGVLFATALHKHARQSMAAQGLHSRIKGLILDSPFGDFKQITKQIALKRMAIPQFLIEFALKFVNQSFEHLLKDQSRGGKVYNPFKINLASGDDIQTGIPTVFVYSMNDEIVEKQHSQAIMKKYKSRYEKVIMEEVTHNQTRPRCYIDRVFQLLARFDKKIERDRRRSSLGSIHETHQISRNSSLYIDTEQESIRRRRGITVQSKQKQRKDKVKESCLEMTEQSFHELNLRKIKSKQYNGHKIQPKRSFIFSSAVDEFQQNPINRRKGSPLRLKLSNSLNKQPRNLAKQNSALFNKQTVIQNPSFPKNQSVQAFYNTISYDSTDILHKKLYKNEEKAQNLDGKQAPRLENKIGCNRGRRQSQANRKIQFQLNHTRYL